MQPAANSSSSAEAPDDGSHSQTGLLEDVKSFWHELHGLTHDHLHLAALETKLAGESLVKMILAGVMVAVLLVTAWLGLIGALVLLLINHGVIASIAMLLGVALNLLAAYLLYGVICRKSHYLKWPATIRSLRPAPRKSDARAMPTENANG